MSISLKDVSGHIDAELMGEADCVITGLAALADAKVGDLSFIVSAKYSKQLATTKASAVIMRSSLKHDYAGVVLYHPDPYLAYAQVSVLFSNKTILSGIHESAVIDPTVQIHDSVSIGANTVIEAGCVIGKDVQIGANSVIQSHTSIGESTRLYPNVNIGVNSKIGRGCIFHPGVVIGADGFGFAPSKNGWVKIEQIGNVVIGDDVEIGANSTVDRAALNSTIIGNGVKIDNLVQIGHNVELGDHTIIASSSAIAGSTKIGQRVRIGGLAGISGHLNIADDVVITARSMVIKSINEPGVMMSSGTIAESNQTWRKNALRFMQLDDWVKRLKSLEKKLSSD